MALFESEPGGGDAAVSLGDKFEILPGAPAAGFGLSTGEAYRATDRDRPGDPLVAVICEPGTPPRYDLIEPLANLRVDVLTNPLGWGVVDWPLRKRRCFALVFPAPSECIAAQMADTIAPFTEDEVLTGVLPSLLEGLKALAAIGITHRAIRPTNLFRRAGDRRIVLGECLSTPPAMGQPDAYETIESAQAKPYGRGSGAFSDDLYALGATLIFLLLGRDPTHGIPDEQIIADKMARGSFTTLLAGARLPLRMLEAIRGLVADDPRERWSLADLDGWLGRRRLPVKQAAPPKRAARALELGGTAHLTARTLADGFARDPAGAAKLVRSGDFEAWLQRSLNDPERNTAVASAMTEAPDAEGSPQEGRLIARIAMALDPRAPVRYGAFAATFDGVGSALAAAYRAGSGAPVIADVILSRLPQFWFSVQGSFKPEQAPQFKVFDKLRLLLEDRRPGFGLDHVLTAGDLLPALERAASGGRIADSLIDRHVAAFIATRCRQAGTDWHNELASANPQQRILGTLHLLARLQALGGPVSLTAIGERIAPQFPALVERYRSRARRARMRAALAKLGGKGNIRELAALIDAPGEQQTDAAEFRAARGEWGAVEHELIALREDVKNRPEQAVELGGQIGILVASLVAVVAALGSLVLMG